MSFDSKILSHVVAICRYLYKNPNIHKYTLVNEVVREGKKKDFQITRADVSKALESLIALEKIQVSKDNVKLSSDFIKTGILQKNGDNFYLISPGSDKHIKINKSIAQGYEVDDIIDYMIERSENEQRVVVLGRNKSPLVQSVISSANTQKRSLKTTSSRPSFKEQTNEQSLEPSQNTKSYPKPKH